MSGLGVGKSRIPVICVSPVQENTKLQVFAPCRPNCVKCDGEGGGAPEDACVLVYDAGCRSDGQAQCRAAGAMAQPEC